MKGKNKMDWKEVAGKVAKAAPMLGSLLGPAGTAAGGIISLIGSAFGLTEEETTPDKINRIIEQDPQALLKFKELEMKHKEKLEELLLEREKIKIEEEKIRLQDVASARSRETTIVQATGKKDYNLYILAWLFISGFFATIIVMTVLSFTDRIPESMPDYMIFLLGNLFGALSAGTGAIIQYFFGSSKSSGDKTTMMANMEWKKK